MIKACVIGHPVEQSLSPRIFELIAERMNSDLDYQRIDMLPENLPSFFSSSASNYVGWNVTIPHKEQIIPLLDAVDPVALEIGAINVVHFHDGSSKGYNTDYLGIIRSLEGKGVDLKGKQALIYGAGGAARAVIYALRQLGVANIYIWNRTQERSETLCRQFNDSNLHPIDDVNAISEPITLLVNTLPKIEDGFSYTLPRKLSNDSIAFDLLYQTPRLPFLEAAKGVHQKLSGLEMLIWQALFTWEIWFGPLTQIEALKDEIHFTLKKKNIYLVGFMGAGKTAIGKELARQLSLPFVDTDEEIEKRARKSIPEIFSTEGEKTFREMEANIVKEVSKESRKVIALGGGVMSNPKNRESLFSSGYVIYLKAPLPLLIERIKETDRPLIHGISEEEIAKLYSERCTDYEKAHITVSSGEGSPKDLAQTIKEAVLS